MEQNRKFYATPNHVVDADYIGEALYFPKAAATRPRNIGGPELAPQRSQAELHLTFKNTGEGISLYGDAADLAWENFKRVTVRTSLSRAFAASEVLPMSTSKKFA